MTECKCRSLKPYYNRITTISGDKKLVNKITLNCQFKIIYNIYFFIPQISPIYWLYLYLFFNFLLVLFFFIIYLYVNKLVVKKEKKIIKEKIFLNKW